MTGPQPLLKFGLSQLASDSLRQIGTPASRVGQTIGSYSGSAGTHEADGRINNVEYTAAVDLHVHDLDDPAMKLLLGRLAGVGFCGFARIPGRDHWPEGEARHVHCVFAGVPCKEQLRRQIHDFCHVPMLNGLKSGAPYLFWQPTAAEVQVVRDHFLASGNPVSG